MLLGNKIVKLAVVFGVLTVMLLFTTCSDSEDDITNGEHEAAHWGYEGEDGPEHWGDLDPDYAACSNGIHQSPIDIDTAAVIHVDLPDIQINYQASTLKVVNNGHTIQAKNSAVNYIEVEGARFDLLQFHFHASSEHTVQGSAYPMELHLVHQNAAGALAVIGVLIAEGLENPVFNPIWDNLSALTAEDFPLPNPLNLDDLLPADQRTYRYTGSLTTPPCSEIVSWLVMAAPIEMSQAQIQAFAAIYDGNARPVQALNGRYILFDASVN